METTEKTMQENKAIACKFWDYFEKGERDKIGNELFAKDFKLHYGSKDRTLNAEESKKDVMKEFNTGFPDLKFTVEEQIAEGNFVVDRFTAQGTHTGEFRGVAATNKKVNFSGIVINRIIDNKIEERWTEVDNLGIMTQLGAIHEMAHQD